MRFFILFFLCLVCAQTVYGDEPKSFDTRVNDVLEEPVGKFVSFIFWGPRVGEGAEQAKIVLVIIWLVVAAAFLTMFFRFINLRGFTHALRIARGDFDDPAHPGQITHFQALTAAVSGTVGIGNIGAVAFAIAMGGPGAVFWLIVAGFLGMTTKFVECTLAVKYRQTNEDGSVSGGPMYYLQAGFAERGFPRFGRVIGIAYGLGIVVGCLGIGNMFQSNQAFEQFVVVTGGDGSFFVGRGWLFGIAIAFVVGLVIVGGIQSIARVTSRLVPFMAILYATAAVIVVAMNWRYLDDAVSSILLGAFRPEAGSGGVVGIMMLGFQRALFSNEAGLGSAAIAHSAVKTRHPVTEGYVSMIGPFLDTIIICTLTSLCIITSMEAVENFARGVSGDGNMEKGIQLTSAAFERNIPGSQYLIAVCAILFAVSTMITWAYYGLKGWTYLVGEGRIRALAFNGVFCVFIVLGCMMQLGVVIDFSDALIYLICVPNILGIYVLAPSVRKDLLAYQQGIASKTS